MDISISVISHGQIAWVAELLQDLEKHCSDSRFELILTLNLDETIPFALDQFSYPVTLLRNAHPMGFAANQNQVFRRAVGRYFCVINPDIRLLNNPFPNLLACLKESSAGVAAPLVVGEAGEPEDSARRFPSPLSILRKACRIGLRPDYVIGDAVIYPDWVGGMFMLFPLCVFAQVGGFDEHYFLYYEDVDICARLRLLGHEVVVCPQAKVVHHAQRHSHRSFRYLLWHLRSMLRFFLSPVYWRVRTRHAP